MSSITRAGKIKSSNSRADKILSANISNNEMFRLISEFSSDWIYWLNKDFSVRFMSPACKFMTGYSLEELVADNPTPLEKIIHPEDLERFLQQKKAAQQGLCFFSGQFRIIKKSGEVRWISHIYQSVYDEQNRFLGRYISNRDITEDIKNVCETCCQKKNFVQQVYEEASVGYYQMYFDGRLRNANKVFCEMLGFDTHFDLIGINLEKTSALELKRRENFKNSIKKFGKVKDYESTWMKKNGSIIILRETATLPKITSDSELYYEGIVHDISEKKKGEYALIEASAKGQSFNRLKAEFLATISHEIRTPLNIVSNSATILKTDIMEMTERERNEYLNMIKEGGKRIQRTIDLILEMSELNVGTYEYNPIELNLVEDILKKIYEEKKEDAGGKQINLVLTDNLFDENIVVDRNGVYQIFTQLIDNAIKYSEYGSVETKLYLNADNRKCAEIIDTGRGINKEYIPYLFNSFSQEDNSYSRMFEGIGLGLAVVKAHCELNNINIEAISDKGIGTRFILTFLQ
jgi:PAS domain S-box-containing protein